MQNSHTLQLQSSLFIPQFRTGCGFMPQGDTFYLLKKDTKRLQPKAVNLNSATTPLLLIFDKLFNLSATVFSICKISIRNNPSLLLHCFLEACRSSAAVLALTQKKLSASNLWVFK